MEQLSCTDENGVLMLVVLVHLLCRKPQSSSWQDITEWAESIHKLNILRYER